MTYRLRANLIFYGFLKGLLYMDSGCSGGVNSEMLVEDISGECRICKKIVNQNELENHIRREHISYIETRLKPKVKDEEVCFVLEEVLDKVIELSDNNEEDKIESVKEDAINIDYDYSIEKSKGDESFKGKNLCLYRQ